MSIWIEFSKPSTDSRHFQLWGSRFLSVFSVFSGQTPREIRACASLTRIASVPQRERVRSTLLARVSVECCEGLTDGIGCANGRLAAESGL